MTCSDEAIAELEAPGGDQAQHLALAAGEPRHRAGLEPQPVPHQRVDDVRVDDALAAAHRLQRRHEVLDVGDALLEQVAAPGAAAGHQRQRSLGIRVLGQHHHPELRVRATEALGGPDALVGVGGRHPDVGQHHVGVVLGDRLEQLTEVTGLDHLVDSRVLGEQRDEPLTEQHAVLREHHAHAGHPHMVGGEAARHRTSAKAARAYRQDGAVLPDLFLRPSERDNPQTVIDEHHPEGVAWSEGNRVRMIAHGRPYMAELHERVEALGEGDLLYFVDWRGDPDQRLTDDPGSTVSATFAAAARRGADVRGLLWRSHWNKLGFHSERVAPARHRDRRGRRAVPARHAGAHRRLAPPEVRRAAAPRRPVARRRLPRRHRPVPQPARRHRPRGRPPGDRDAAGVRPAPGLARRARGRSRGRPSSTSRPPSASGGRTRHR